MEVCASSKRISGEKVTQGGTGYLRRARGVSVEGLAVNVGGGRTENRSRQCCGRALPTTRSSAEYGRYFFKRKIQ